MTKQALQNIVANLAGSVRHDSMEGREYLVAPMVMLTEGVHVANRGAAYYPPEEIEKSVVAWNTKPIVVYHPQKNGQYVSAADPDILTNRKVGVVLNARYEDGKLVAEAWLDKERVEEVDSRILEALEEGKNIEVSTGLFMDAEESEGVWNNEEYNAVARNFQPDHLAILPDRKGACSLEDGCGILVNALAHEDLRESLSASLQERLGSGASFWIANVFDKTVVYEYQGKLWALPYTKSSNSVTIGSDVPVEVRRNVQYRTLEGKLIGNASLPPIDLEKKTMTKKEELVAQLISCNQTKWGEDDKDFLVGLTECQLEKMLPVEPTANEEEEKKDDNQPPVANEDEPTKPITAEEYVANAPADIRDMLTAGLQAHREERRRLIEVITSNERNRFSKEELETMSKDQLVGLAALAEQPKPEKQANYIGAAGTVEPTSNVEEEEPLPLPVMTFDD